MKFNDLDLKNWKELDINVDSLWLIDERDKSGRHSNIYHGNFIPHQVYSSGVTEWEALDEIQCIQSPNQMLWSLIYRKLKGNRGNTMITIYESERLISLIRNKNNLTPLGGEDFTFNEVTQSIETMTERHHYSGRQEVINILPRLANKFSKGMQFETHLQAYILQHLESLPMFEGLDIEWIGNEVSCGVGMQRIDIVISVNSLSRKLIPIELKSNIASPDITKQLQRYIDWIQQYYLPNRPSDIEPMIISREIADKTLQNYKDLIASFCLFNEENRILPLRYIEFSIDEDAGNINFSEVEY